MGFFPKGFDKLRSDFARAALDLPLPNNLSKVKNQRRWALYVSSLSFKQLVDKFASGTDELNSKLNNTPYVFDIKPICKAKKAGIYSNVIANAQMGREICKRLRVEGQIVGLSDADTIQKACARMIDFDDDDPQIRKEWVERHAKASLLKQNPSFIALDKKIEDKPKYFKKLARCL